MSRARHSGAAPRVQIFRDLEDCYSAAPWRFDVDARCQTLNEPMPPVANLEDSVQRLSGGVAEEMVIDDLGVVPTARALLRPASTASAEKLSSGRTPGGRW